MTELNTLLNQIKAEKDTKILPENLKKDIEAFGVTGTYEGPIMQYSSVQEMNQHTDLDDGTYALIINSTNSNLEAVYKLVDSTWILVGNPTEALQTFVDLADVMGGAEPEYEGLGGTEEEIIEILEEVINGEEE